MARRGGQTAGRQPIDARPSAASWITCEPHVGYARDATIRGRVTRRSTWAIVATAVALVVAVAMAEQAMGRVIICRCGYVKLWHGVVSSAENSQHVTDWYTPSHVIHGMAFYGLLWLVARRTPVGVRFLAAMFIEGAGKCSRTRRS